MISFMMSLVPPSMGPSRASRQWRGRRCFGGACVMTTYQQDCARGRQRRATGEEPARARRFLTGREQHPGLAFAGG